MSEIELPLSQGYHFCCNIYKGYCRIAQLNVTTYNLIKHKLFSQCLPILIARPFAFIHTRSSV